MNQFARLTLTLLFFPLGQSQMLLANENPSPSAFVVLNGLTSLFGDTRVFLQVAASDFPLQSVSLTPGQQVAGIQLLEVNVNEATVRIDNRGKLQNLRISRQDLCGATAGNRADEAGATIVHSPAETAPRLPNGQLALDGSIPAKTHIYYWWLADAQEIEQTRINTAAQVLAGELPPQPLTPLTPPETSAKLIGPDSIFMEHGRGVVVND